MGRSGRWLGFAKHGSLRRALIRNTSMCVRFVYLATNPKHGSHDLKAVGQDTYVREHAYAYSLKS